MYYGQRTFQDLKNMNPLVGKTFFEEGEGRFEGMIRTYYMAWNGFANRITPQITNYHQAEPTEDMKPIHPKILSSLTMQRNQPEFY